MKNFLFVVALLLGPGLGEGRGRELGSADFRILTYNVAGIPIIDRTRAARLSAIAGRLETSPYELALFQEVWLDGDAATLARKGGFGYAARESRGLIGNGLLILSRYPILKTAYRRYALKSPGSKDDWINRGVLAARISTPWGPWDIYNTHLTHVENETAVRLAQVIELSEAIADFSQGRPYLLGGDFNFTPGSTESVILKGILGVEDLCLAAGVDSCGATSMDTGRRVDFLLAGDARLASSVRTSFSGTFDHRGREIPYSDHLALEALISPALLSVPVQPRPEERKRVLQAAEAAFAREIERLNAGLGRELPGASEDHQRQRISDFERIRRRIGE